MTNWASSLMQVRMKSRKAIGKCLAFYPCSFSDHTQFCGIQLTLRDRKAALKYHPDKNKDKPDASEKFKGWMILPGLMRGLLLTYGQRFLKRTRYCRIQRSARLMINMA